MALVASEAETALAAALAPQQHWTHSLHSYSRAACSQPQLQRSTAAAARLTAAAAVQALVASEAETALAAALVASMLEALMHAALRRRMLAALRRRRRRRRQLRLHLGPPTRRQRTRGRGDGSPVWPRRPTSPVGEIQQCAVVEHGEEVTS